MQKMRSRVARIGSVLVFFGTGLAAHGEIIVFKATLTGSCAQTDSDVTGSGRFTLDTDTGLFRYTVIHEALPSGGSFRHIHGPLADACSQQGGGSILLSLSPPVGSIMLDAQQQADMIAELYYVNIHSVLHFNGEISGIIEQVELPARNRYLSFKPESGAGELAYSISLPDGWEGWVGEPQSLDWDGIDLLRVSLVVDAPVFRSWTEDVVNITGCVVVPNEQYPLRFTSDGINFSSPQLLETVPSPTVGTWADIVGAFDTFTQTWDPPNGVVNFQDIDAAVKKFQVDPTAPHVSVVDLHPQWPNYLVNFSDIDMVIKGFQDIAYPVPPQDCQTIASCPLGEAAPCLLR